MTSLFEKYQRQKPFVPPEELAKLPTEAAKARMVLQAACNCAKNGEPVCPRLLGAMAKAAEVYSRPGNY